MMATIELYDTAAGKRYQVRYRTPQRTQTKKRGFKTKRDAQEFAATVEVEKMTGSYVAPSLGMITVGELAPVWGRTRVADIDLGAVERWIATMKKTSGATTVVRAYGVLAGILDDAVKGRRLARNPARGVENLPEKSGKRRVYLTVEDVARLAVESGQQRPIPVSGGAKPWRFGCAISSSYGDG